MERQRLDKWLWHARVVKARTSAAALVEAGHVRINGVREKAPGHAVKIGDVLTIALDRTVRILKVTGFSERRGDAAAARVLYDDLQNRQRVTMCTELAARPENGGLRPPLPLRQRTACATQTPETDPFRSLVSEPWMTYVVTEACIKCKYTDCVEVCPVDCFYEGENMLVIHPDECIDCGVCEPECPADAIKPDTEPGLEKWLEVNTEYAKSWPNITQKKDMPSDAKEFEGVEGKFEKYFSKEPGSGD